MGHITLAVRLRDRPNKAGEHLVWIRLTKERDIVYWPINLTLPLKYFNVNATKQQKNWVRRSCYDHDVYNKRILNAYQQAEKAIDFFDKRDIEYTAAQVRDYLNQGGYPERLLVYFEQHIAQRIREAGSDLGKLKTTESYQSTIKLFRRYLREIHKISDGVTDTEIDNSYWLLGRFSKKDILDLKAWLDNQYAENSVSSYLRNLRHVLYLAADMGLVSYEKFPMRGVSFGIKRKKVQRLQEDEIDLLSSGDAPKKHKGGHPAVTDPVHARPLAMAMYLVHGARLGDALMWRVGNYVIEGDVHRLRYETGKNHKSMSVLLESQAVALLASYLRREDGAPKASNEFLFPYLPGNFDKLPTADQFVILRRAKIRARQQIIRLGERIGLTKRVTPHVMRHSFADMMRREGVPLETRQNSLGHSDIKTTRNYEEQFDQESIDEVSRLYKKKDTLPDD